MSGGFVSCKLAVCLLTHTDGSVIIFIPPLREHTGGNCGVVCNVQGEFSLRINAKQDVIFVRFESIFIFADFPGSVLVFFQDTIAAKNKEVLCNICATEFNSIYLSILSVLQRKHVYRLNSKCFFY